jgi:hypothetical protein
MDAVASLPTLEELRAFVLDTLCRHDALDPKQTPLLQGVMLRRGRPCGLMFEVRGPRLLRASAVWAGDENRIFFYDASGMRFGVVRLSEAPDPLKLVA